MLIGVLLVHWATIRMASLTLENIKMKAMVIKRQVADDVRNFNVGDAVYSCAGGIADINGTLAEFILVDVALVALKQKL